MFIIIYTTHTDEEEAHRISNALIQSRIVACSNIMPIHSCYWWMNGIENEDEYVCIYKTRPENWEITKQEIKRLHPHNIPCIMRIEVEGNEEYEEWIYENSKLVG